MKCTMCKRQKAMMFFRIWPVCSKCFRMIIAHNPTQRTQISEQLKFTEMKGGNQ